MPTKTKLTQQQRDYIFENAGKLTLSDIVKDLFGDDPDKKHYNAVYFYVTHNKIKVQKRVYSRLKKKVYKKAQSRQVFAPAVYSNPQWHKVY